jgi:hypothetical protein
MQSARDTARLLHNRAGGLDEEVEGMVICTASPSGARGELLLIHDEDPILVSRSEELGSL